MDGQLDDFIAQIGHPTLRRAVELWCAKRGERKAPLRSDIDPVEFQFALGYISLVEARGDPSANFRKSEIPEPRPRPQESWRMSPNDGTRRIAPVESLGSNRRSVTAGSRRFFSASMAPGWSNFLASIARGSTWTSASPKNMAVWPARASAPRSTPANRNTASGRTNTVTGYCATRRRSCRCRRPARRSTCCWSC